MYKPIMYLFLRTRLGAEPRLKLLVLMLKRLCASLVGAKVGEVKFSLPHKVLGLDAAQSVFPQVTCCSPRARPVLTLATARNQAKGGRVAATAAVGPCRGGGTLSAEGGLGQAGFTDLSRG